MKKWVIIGVLAVIVAALGMQARRAWVNKQQQKAQQNVVVTPRVEVTHASMQEVVDQVPVWGTVVAEQSVTVFSKLAGKLISVDVNEGETVTAEQKLAVLDRDLAPLQYEQSQVSAPITGVVVKRMVDVGSVITPQTPLFVIENPQSMKVQVPIPQSLLSRVRTGMPVELTCEALGKQVLKSVISKILPIADAKTQTASLEISIRDSRLKSGMTLQASIQLERRKVLAVPSIVVSEQSEQAVVAVVQNGKVSKRVVKAGTRYGNLREVIEGISPEDVLIDGGSDFFSNGDSVIVVERSIGQ